MFMCSLVVSRIPNFHTLHCVSIVLNIFNYFISWLSQVHAGGGSTFNVNDLCFSIGLNGDHLSFF